LNSAALPALPSRASVTFDRYFAASIL
jgi:hypothetical protein